MQNDTHHSIRCVSFCRVGDLFARLERCECVPVRILLRCGLNVGRQVGEEIEAGEPFDLGDGSRIVRVAIVRVLPVFHPETDRYGRRHFVRRVAPDFQQRFVVIVRYGASFAVRLRCDQVIASWLPAVWRIAPVTTYTVSVVAAIFRTPLSSCCQIPPLNLF